MIIYYTESQILRRQLCVRDCVLLRAFWIHETHAYLCVGEREKESSSESECVVFDVIRRCESISRLSEHSDKQQMQQHRAVSRISAPLECRTCAAECRAIDVTPNFSFFHVAIFIQACVRVQPCFRWPTRSYDLYAAFYRLHLFLQSVANGR